jgi:hypothetical protein
MLDFFFFLKTMLLTLVVVLLLQIEIGGKTAETHVHDWMVGSVAAGFIGNAAHGGANFLKDASFKMTKKIKEHMGAKAKKESSEIKASHFHWGWQKAKDAEIDEASENNSPLNTRDRD